MNSTRDKIMKNSNGIQMKKKKKKKKIMKITRFVLNTNMSLSVRYIMKNSSKPIGTNLNNGF